MKNVYIISITVLSLLFIGCGSRSGPDLSPEASSKTVKNLPDWYKITPVKEGFKYKHPKLQVSPCN